MSQITDLLVNKVINFELDIINIPTKFKSPVIAKLIEIGFITDNDISAVQQAKISEMSESCNSVIVNGFDVVLSDGVSHHFSLTEQDQLNLITLQSDVASGAESIPYHIDGELCEYYSVEDITKIISTARSFKMYNITYFNSLKYYISSLTNISEINNIVYGIEIPEEYKSDVLKSL